MTGTAAAMRAVAGRGDQPSTLGAVGDLRAVAAVAGRDHPDQRAIDGFDAIARRMERYENRERKADIDDATLARDLQRLRSDIDTYKRQHPTGDPDHARRLRAIEAVEPRLAYQQRLMESGQADRQRSYADVDQGGAPARDNALGGGINRLDLMAGGLYKPAMHHESRALAGDGAKSIKIPGENPNYEGRSMASDLVDSQLRDREIRIGRRAASGKSEDRALVPSRFATHRREQVDRRGRRIDDRDTMGIHMDRVNGLEVRGKLIDEDRLTLGSEAGRVRIDDPELQRGLNKLQLLDALNGQVDRHQGNYFADVDEHGRVRDVVGIDNDMADGKGHTDVHDLHAGPSYRGLPPVADYDTAKKILAMDPEQLRRDLEGLLTTQEIDAKVARLTQTQQALATYEAEGRLIRSWDKDAARHAREDAIRAARGDQRKATTYAGAAAVEAASRTMRGTTDLLRDAWPGGQKEITARTLRDVQGPLMVAVLEGRITREALPYVTNKVAEDLAETERNDPDFFAHDHATLDAAVQQAVAAADASPEAARARAEEKRERLEGLDAEKEETDRGTHEAKEEEAERLERENALEDDAASLAARAPQEHREQAKAEAVAQLRAEQAQNDAKVAAEEARRRADERAAAAEAEAAAPRQGPDGRPLVGEDGEIRGRDDRDPEERADDVGAAARAIDAQVLRRAGSFADLRSMQNAALRAARAHGARGLLRTNSEGRMQGVARVNPRAATRWRTVPDRLLAVPDHQAQARADADAPGGAVSPMDAPAFLARRQRSDGSFGSQIDRTAAALLALVHLGHHKGAGRDVAWLAAGWLGQHFGDPLADAALGAFEGTATRPTSAWYVLTKADLEGAVLYDALRGRSGRR